MALNDQNSNNPQKSSAKNTLMYDSKPGESTSVSFSNLDKSLVPLKWVPEVFFCWESWVI